MCSFASGARSARRQQVSPFRIYDFFKSCYAFESKISFARWFFYNFLALMHFVFIFFQKCAPRGCQKHIFENQLWAISLQKSIFWTLECPKLGISGPSFWHLSLFCPFGSPFVAFNRPSEFLFSLGKMCIFASGARSAKRQQVSHLRIYDFFKSCCELASNM